MWVKGGNKKGVISVNENLFVNILLFKTKMLK